MSYLKIGVSYGIQSNELMLYYFIGNTILIYKVIFFLVKGERLVGFVLTTWLHI